MPGRYVELTWHHDPSLYAPARYRRACRYKAFVPDPVADMALSLDAYVAGAVSEAEASIQVLNAAAHPALAPLARLLLRTESIASSKVEGMQLGIRELARAEARLETGGKAGATAVEILANMDAMELAVEHATSARAFGVGEIVAIHHRLMEKGADARMAGQVRTVQNWIGGNDYNPRGADFVPPPPERVDAFLSDLCAAVNDDRLPPIVQAALVHAQFETIHPFEDGNGRTGRALIHVVLRRRGIAPAYVPPISVILSSSRARYIEGLMGFRADRVVDWVRQFAEAASGAARLAHAYLKAVQDLIERWRGQLATRGAPRGDAAAWALIDALPAHPVITASAAAGTTGRAKAAVYQALGELVDAGVLVPLSQSSRNQSWEAVGLIDLLSGLAAGRLPDGDAARPMGNSSARRRKPRSSRL